MRVVLTGTGTSHGIPVVACSCPVCLSSDPKDIRLRSGAFVHSADSSIIIDCGPEFRIQALKFNLRSLDALLLTHSHADHVHGLDDIRIFSVNQPVPIYANAQTISDLRERFAYIFAHTQEGGGKPHIELCEVFDKPFMIGSLCVQPIPLFHGTVAVCGWRLQEGETGFSCAYLTDVDFIPEASYELLQGLDYLVIDGLRIRSHTTHFNFSEAAEAAQRINAKHSYITHICHEMSHKDLIEYCKDKKIEPAYDGLCFE